MIAQIRMLILVHVEKEPSEQKPTDSACANSRQASVMTFNTRWVKMILSEKPFLSPIGHTSQESHGRRLGVPDHSQLADI